MRHRLMWAWVWLVAIAVSSVQSMAQEYTEFSSLEEINATFGNPGPGVQLLGLTPTGDDDVFHVTSHRIWGDGESEYGNEVVVDAGIFELTDGFGIDSELTFRVEGVVNDVPPICPDCGIDPADYLGSVFEMTSVRVFGVMHLSSGESVALSSLISLCEWSDDQGKCAGSELLLLPQSLGEDSVWGNDPQVRRILRFFKDRDDRSPAVVKKYRELAKRYGRPFRGLPMLPSSATQCDIDFILCFEKAVDDYTERIARCDGMDNGLDLFVDAFTATVGICAAGGATTGATFCKRIPLPGGAVAGKPLGGFIGGVVGGLGALGGSLTYACFADSEQDNCRQVERANAAGDVIACGNERRRCILASEGDQIRPVIDE